MMPETDDSGDVMIGMEKGMVYILNVDHSKTRYKYSTTNEFMHDQSARNEGYLTDP